MKRIGDALKLMKDQELKMYLVEPAHFHLFACYYYYFDSLRPYTYNYSGNPQAKPFAIYA